MQYYIGKCISCYFNMEIEIMNYFKDRSKNEYGYNL